MILTILLGLIGSTLFAAGAEPPVNPYLADSPWPMSHRNPYCQASSPFPGPRADGVKSVKLISEEAVAITLNLTPRRSGEYSVWAGARNKVYTLNERWKKRGAIRKVGSSTKALSGAYTVLDRDGRLFVPRGPEIQVYEDAEDPKVIRRFVVVPNSEMLVGLNLTYDGHLAWVTNRSLVGITNRETGKTWRYQIPGGEMTSNSLALDEEGGLYVVTDRRMHRVQWNGEGLFPVWSTAYAVTSQPMPGRLGLGSGTTPTLMGTGNEDKLVVIADGMQKMHVVGFWRATGAVAGTVPITFGDPNRPRAITEQSLLVTGYEALAVNNDYGERKTGGFANLWTILFSNESDIAPYGIEKFRWVPTEKRFESVWANPSLSSPNGIPSLSTATGLAYYIGQHRENWTFEAVNWETGKLAFRHILGKGVRFNSFYAATEIGYDGELLSGTFGGALRLTSE